MRRVAPPALSLALASVSRLHAGQVLPFINFGTTSRFVVGLLLGACV
jgi:hypothetical protein